MRPGTEVFEPGRARLLVTTGPLGRGLGADVESRCSGFQRRTPLHNHFRQLLSTMNRQSGILVIVHSVSPEKLIARHNQLLSFRSNGQPVETSQLEHFRNTRRLFKSIERWLFLEEKATQHSAFGLHQFRKCYSRSPEKEYGIHEG